MKKISAILALLCVACSTPEPEIIYRDVEVDPVYEDVVKVIGVSQTEFDGKGGKAEFILKSNLTYTLSSDKDWVVVPSTRAESLPQNEAIVFEVKPYEIDYVGVSRTATITITSTDGSVSDKVEISQTPKDTYHLKLLSVEPQTLTSAGGEIVVTISATLAYKVELEENDWLTLVSDNGEGVITLSAPKYLATYDRACVLVVSAEGMEPLRITITQTSYLTEHDNVIVVPMPDKGVQE